VDIGNLEEDYSSEWASTFPIFLIPEENASSKVRVFSDFGMLNLFLENFLSPISYSEDWAHDRFNGRIFLCFRIGLKYGLISHQTRY
jgi:hypothetical protein